MHAGWLLFNGAFVTLMPALVLGTTYVLQARFDAKEFIETVQREQVTHVMMVPSQIVGVIHAPNFSGDKPASLRMLCSVAAPCHPEHKEALLPLLPKSRYELYGPTAASITALGPTDLARKNPPVDMPNPSSDTATPKAVFEVKRFALVALATSG